MPRHDERTRLLRQVPEGQLDELGLAGAVAWI